MLTSVVSGLIAGMTSTVVTFPLDLTMRNLQVCAPRSSTSASDSLCAIKAGLTHRVCTGLDNTQMGGTRKQFDGPLHCMRHIAQKHGIAGFYRGLIPQLAKAVPFACTSWVMFDFAGRMLHLEPKY